MFIRILNFEIDFGLDLYEPYTKVSLIITRNFKDGKFKQYFIL